MAVISETHHRPRPPVMSYSAFRTVIVASILTILEGCSDSQSGGSTAPSATKPDPIVEYNAELDRIAPAAPRSELETTVVFEERKSKHLSYLEGKRYKLTVPVTLGKCQEPKEGDPPGPRNFPGLRYMADDAQLIICSLDEVAINANCKRSLYGVVPTQVKKSEGSYEASNMLGMKATINSTKMLGKGFFVPAREPSSHPRDEGRTTVRMDPKMAKDLYDNGAKLVYEIELAPSMGEGLIESTVKREGDMLSRIEYVEHIKGVLAHLKSVSLEDKQGKLLARFEFRNGSVSTRLLQVAEPEAVIDIGEKIHTRYGDLQVGPGAVYFHDKKIIELDSYESIAIHGVHQLRDIDVAVAGLDGGGSGGFTDFVLIMASPDGSSRIFKADGNEGLSLLDKSEIKVKQKGGSLVFDLGYQQGRHREGVFDGKALKVSLRDSGPAPIPEYICKNLYATLESCVHRGSTKPECSSTYDDLSNAESRSTWPAFDYPNMTKERFGKYCDMACATGRRLPYAGHKSALCDIGATNSAAAETALPLADSTARRSP